MPTCEFCGHYDHPDRTGRCPACGEAYFNEKGGCLGQSEMLLLEDQTGGETWQRALLGGGPETYTIVAKDLESGREWMRTLDSREANEFAKNWAVIRKLADDGSPVDLSKVMGDDDAA